MTRFIFVNEQTMSVEKLFADDGDVDRLFLDWKNFGLRVDGDFHLPWYFHFV